MILKNYMETLVEQNLDMVIKSMGGCTCDQCRLDVMALALNSLKPQYVASHKGEVFSKIKDMEDQYHADVISAITVGVATVKNNSRHDQLI